MAVAGFPNRLLHFIVPYAVGVALPDVAWPAARSAALWAFCRRQNAPEGRETSVA